MKMLYQVATFMLVFSLSGCFQPTSRMTKGIPEWIPPPGSEAPRSEGSGTLAYIGGDGNVWITSPTEGWKRPVTSDATTPPEGQGRSYHRVAWSRHGGLAFASVVRSRDNAHGELFLQRALDQSPQLVAENDKHFFIYIYASPIPCLDRSNCPLLAYLVEEADGVGLHLIKVGDSDVQDLLLHVGRPIYLSWSPDGQRLLWHAGGALRDNPAAEIGLYQLGEGRRRILPYAPGAFYAPAWSPQGDRWLSVVASDDVDRLQMVTPDGIAALASTAGQEIAFVWSPNGDHIAYAVRESDNEGFYGPVQVMDSQTGDARQATSDAFDILGFFWSPDGRRLAYLSRLNLPDAVWMQWRAVDTVDGHDRGFTTFHPSPLMRFVIHSFGQYAQSHQFWSPDGRYLVYADRDDRGADRVWLVDTHATQGTSPILIDDGSIGVWSWQ